MYILFINTPNKMKMVWGFIHFSQVKINWHKYWTLHRRILKTITEAVEEKLECEVPIF